VIRAGAGLSVTRMCQLLGMPRASWYRWRAAVGADRPRPGKGPWPALVVDRIEPLAAKHAEQWAAWGHRKVWGLLAADGVAVSQSSVRRAMARRGLLQPVGYQAERRQLAQARRAVFLDPPTRRNRVWQTDFSELESLAGGIWRLSGVVDYWAKLCLACPVTTTQATRDAVAALEAAIDQAERLLGYELLQDCVDHHTGELLPVVVVTDNGPAYRSGGFALHRQPTRAAARAHPAPLAADQRRGRAVLPGDQVRAPVPARDPRRPGPGQGGGQLPDDLQQRPPTRGDRLHHPARPLSASPVHPAGGQPSTTRNCLRFLTRDKIEVRSYVGGLVQSFERKAA